MPSPVARGPSRASYLAPALLVLVAVLHAVAVSRGHFTRWKGGGFAMFSTIDRPGNRFLRAAIIGNGTVTAVDVRQVRALEPTMTEKSLAAPTTARVQALAARSARMFEPAAGRALRLSIWNLSYDSRSRRLERRELASATAPLAGDQDGNR
jgi:hypothetical protein